MTKTTRSLPISIGRVPRAALAAAALLMSGLAAERASADTYQWGLAGGGTWDAAPSTPAPFVSGNLAAFGGEFSTARAIAVPAPLTASGIAFRGVSGIAGYTIGTTAGSTITLDSGTASGSHRANGTYL